MKYNKDEVFFKQELVGEDIKYHLVEYSEMSEEEAKKYIEENREEIKADLGRVIYGLQEDWGIQLCFLLEDGKE